MVHVEITNFQSIKHLSFDFEGFTTIVGRNFIGKSASLRAINAALTNQQGTDFIRWGERFCEVLIQTKDIKILWHKEDGNNFYQINDEKDLYEKVGNQPIPKPVAKAGFGLITVGKEKINLLYARQFFPLFLIDRLDTKSADLLISIYGLDKLYKAIDLCAKDQRKNTELLKLRKNDLEQSEKDLEKYKDFDSIKSIVTALDTTRKELGSKKELIDRLTYWFLLLVGQTKEIKKYRPVREIVVPSCDSVEVVIKELEKISGFLKKVNDNKKELGRLSEIKNVIFPETAAEDLSEKIKNVSNLQTLQKKYEEISIQISVLQKAKKIVIPEVPGDATKDLETLKNTYIKLFTINTDVKTLRASVESNKKELEAATTELKKFDHCPTCGAEFKS